MSTHFTIVLVYYDRPRMVCNALRSIRDMNYDNWTLGFIDDGSTVVGSKIVKKILGDKLGERITSINNIEKRFEKEVYDKAILYRVNDTIQDKRDQNGTRHPEFMNRVIAESPGGAEDVVVILCDDDALLPDYLEKLDVWYRENPDPAYSYCHLVPFDPTKEKPSIDMVGRSFWLNHGRAVIPYSTIDGSQSTFRKGCFTVDGIQYPSPAHRCLDAALHEALQKAYGACLFNGINGQYKGDFADQLGKRNQGNEYEPQDIPDQVWAEIYGESIDWLNE